MVEVLPQEDSRRSGIFSSYEAVGKPTHGPCCARRNLSKGLVPSDTKVAIRLEPVGVIQQARKLIGIIAFCLPCCPRRTITCPWHQYSSEPIARKSGYTTSHSNQRMSLAAGWRPHPPAPLSTKVAEGGGEILRGLVWSIPCRCLGMIYFFDYRHSSVLPAEVSLLDNQMALASVYF